MSARLARRHRIPRALAAALLLVGLLPAAGFARPKTDVVVLRNGDRIQGEIYSLEYGRLRLKTDSMSSVYIEWPDVVAVWSPHLFTIEDASGAVLVGALAMTPDSARVIIRGTSGGSETTLPEIARIGQLGEGFWQRIDGSVSLGLDYEKSTDIALLRSRFDSVYRNPKLLASLGATADISRAPEQEAHESFSVTSALRLLAGRSRFWVGGLQWQRNEELGIDSRVQVAVGPGRYLYRSPESQASTFLGIGANQEWAVGTGDPTLSAELVVGGDWRTFRFRDPETSIVTSLQALPSLTESGRYRLDYNLTFKVKVISDLTVDLTYYADVDNKPPAGGEKLDTGISTSIGYTF